MTEYIANDMAKRGGFHKASNEGSGSPFMARLFIGMCKLLDELLLPSTNAAQRDSVLTRFDSKLQPLIRSAQASKDAAAEILSALSEQASAIESGEVVVVDGDYFSVNKTVDERLAQAIDKLVTQSIITTKTRLQQLLRDPLQLDIGFFFQAQVAFDAGLKILRSDGEEELATYLHRVRTGWHESLQTLRAEIEHGDWTLPALSYRWSENGKIDIGLPVIQNMDLRQFAVMTANRVILFAEEMLAYAMQRLRRTPFVIEEVPWNQRDPMNPRRFRVWVSPKNSDGIWKPTYYEAREFV